MESCHTRRLATLEPVAVSLLLFPRSMINAASKHFLLSHSHSHSAVSLAFNEHHPPTSNVLCLSSALSIALSLSLSLSNSPSFSCSLSLFALPIVMSSPAPQPCPSSCFKLYYPPGHLGRAEPIRLLLTEASQPWEEPWARAGLSHEQSMAEMERMRERLQQPLFGLPWLEHSRAPHSVEQKDEQKAADTVYLGQSPVRAHLDTRPSRDCLSLATVLH